MIKTLIEYSLKEIEMAEDYVKLACHIDDPATSQKFNEFAKEEIKHYDFIKSVLKNKEMEMEKQNPEKDVHKEFKDSYQEMLDDWKDKVVYKINSYQPKK